MVASVSVRSVASDTAMGADAQELMSFFREHETAIGLKAIDAAVMAPAVDPGEPRCTWCWSFDWRQRRRARAMCKACLGSGKLTPTAQPSGKEHNGGPPSAWDPHVDRLSREFEEQRDRGLDLCERTSRGTRVWRSLRALDTLGDVRSIIVLHRLYGYVTVPIGYHATFGDDLGQLASLTAAAEDAREMVAWQRGEERESGVRLRAEVVREDTQDELVRQFWEAVSHEGRWRERARHARPASEKRPTSKRVAYERRAEAWRQVQQRVLDVYRCDGRLAAQFSVYASADKETTVDEAIAAKLAEKDTPRREQFILDVKRDARALKLAAHQAYRLARTGRLGAM